MCEPMTFQKEKSSRTIQSPRRRGATGRTRTDGLRITNALLYQLSHSSIFNFFFYSVLVLNLSLSSAFGLRIYGQK